MAMPASSSVPTASWPWRPTIATSASVVETPPKKAANGQGVDAERLGQRRGQAIAQRDGGDGGQRGTRGHADQSRIGQRIAEHALHHGAGHGQRRAHEHAEQQARQADVEQHQLLARAGGVVLPGGDGAPARAAARPA